ncbi:MAG: TRAP transporter substrate-binding protein DctP [Rhodospirillaceae bacterium]|nr:TRAP transporter substrate-binding protein DctP [Rhodospirillaceae bacterium]
MTRAIIAMAALMYAGLTPARAADKIPTTIAAFSMPQLASDGYYKRWGRALAEAPGTPFDVKLLILGEAGPDEAIFNALRRDRVQLVGVGYASISTAIPEFTVLNAPFLFDSWEEVDFVYDNYLIPLLNELMAANDIIGIRHYGMVWHGVYGRRPIIEPSDVKKVRFRALVDPASQFMAEILGGDMIQIASTEVVTGLQTGLIDGGETNDLIYLMSGFGADAPHYTLTQHTPSMLGVIANKTWWNRLTPDQQTLVRSSYVDAATARAGIRADGLRELDLAVRTKGVVPHAVSPEARARWKQATLPVHARLIAQAGGRAQEIYDRAMDGKRAFAAKTQSQGPTP